MNLFRKFSIWLKANRLTVDYRDGVVKVVPEPILKGENMNGAMAVGLLIASVLNHDVVIEGLVLTESGGNANAVGDGGRSLGVCQMGKAAWEDTLKWNPTLKWDYSTFVKDPVVNRIMADNYINGVIPKKYFERWKIPDSVPARLAAYKCGPGRFYQIWVDHKDNWQPFLPAKVIRDLCKYNAFVKKELDRVASQKRK